MGRLIHRFLTLVILFPPILALMGSVAAAGGQNEKNPPAPYASIESRGVSYIGPGRETAYDLPGNTVRIGLLAPLHGPQKADGDAIVAAAQLAIEDASRHPLPGGRRVALAVGDESGPSWGLVAGELMRLVLDEHAVAVVTSASGATAHLGEQVGNRIGVPILTLSSDTTTTQIDIPWIFRLGPSDAVQATVIARDIYRHRHLRRVLLVTERDHDGRIGAKGFQRAAQSLGAPDPACLFINPLHPDPASLLGLVKTKAPEAIVFWTRPQTASTLVQQLQEGKVHAIVYLSQQAADGCVALKLSPTTAAQVKPRDESSVWTLASDTAGASAQESFGRRYQASTGMLPGTIAAEAYDAVRLVVHALREAGPNRARVRDQIANARNVSGASGEISFDAEGNNRTGIQLVRLQ